METVFIDWIELLLRWTHMITGIAWIGSSFFFVWLDLSLRKREGGDAAVQADRAIAIEAKATQECGLIGKPATARASSLVSMAVIEVWTVCMGCHFRLFRRSGRLMKAGFCGLGYGPRVVAAGWGLGKKLA